GSSGHCPTERRGRVVTNPGGPLSHKEPAWEREDGSATFIDVVHHRVLDRVRPRTGPGGVGPRLPRGGDGPKSGSGRGPRRRAPGPRTGPAARRDRSGPG